MASDNLREKIRKLFDMAEMGTTHEAEVAMKKARELMDAHGVTQDDINLFTVDIPAPKRKTRWFIMLVNVVSEFSGVAAVGMYKRFTFAGDEIGVNVARELLEYLKNEIERQLKKRNIKGQKLKNSFRIGCILSIRKKMEVLGGWRDMQEKRKRINEKYFSKLKEYKGKAISVDRISFQSGVQGAADININRQAGVNARAGLISEGKI